MQIFYKSHNQYFDFLKLQLIRLFVQRVRTKMADSWDENIVKKAQEGIED